MIVTVSKKMNVFLLLAVVMHSSSVFGMATVLNMGYDLWQSTKKMVTTSYIYNGGLSEFQAKRVMPALATLGVGLGTLGLIYKNDKLDDRQLLGSFGALSLGAGVATSYVAQRGTEKAMFDSCVNDLEKLKQSPYLKRFRPAMKTDEDITNHIIETTQWKQGEYQLDNAKENIDTLSSQAKELEKKINKLGQINKISVLSQEEKEEGAKSLKPTMSEYDNTNLLRTIGDIISDLDRQGEVLSYAFLNQEYAQSRLVHIQQQKLNMLKTWRTGLVSSFAVIAAGVGAYFGMQKYAK